MELRGGCTILKSQNAPFALFVLKIPRIVISRKFSVHKYCSPKAYFHVCYLVLKIQFPFKNKKAHRSLGSKGRSKSLVVYSTVLTEIGTVLRVL